MFSLTERIRILGTSAHYLVLHEMYILDYSNVSIVENIRHAKNISIL